MSTITLHFLPIRQPGRDAFEAAGMAQRYDQDRRQLHFFRYPATGTDFSGTIGLWLRQGFHL
jgi:hypothetical protein